VDTLAEESPLVVARRHVVVSAMREVGAASEDLKNMFETLVSGVDGAIERIEHGGSALHVAEAMSLADYREALNAGAARVRRARHDFQRAMFLLAMAEGSSLADIARAWRVSRQLVSRMTKEEPRAAPTDGEGLA
jgi:hypothetical protein